MAQNGIEKKVSNYLFYDFVRLTAALPGLLWLRPKHVYENENAKKRVRGGALVIANHTGFLDPILLMYAIWYRRHHFVCMDSIFDSRVRNWLFTRFHCIPINRDNLSMRQLKRITGELQQGHLVTMFPEGHLNGEGKLSPFKSGMILLAIMSLKPIVPVYVKYPAHWYSRLTVCIGEPYDAAGILGKTPTLDRIEGAAKELEEKEKQLTELINRP